MTTSKWLILIGNALLIVGLLLALFSNYYTSKVMGKAALGVAVLAPEKDSPEWKRKVKIRKISNVCFYIGIALTSLGIILGTIGSLIHE